jgi:hypothetical protein
VLLTLARKNIDKMKKLFYEKAVFDIFSGRSAVSIMILFAFKLI